jgi:hypothetical protein
LIGDGEAWRRVDWWSAAFWHLNASAERAVERERGPIHSYGFRLHGWDARIWDHAWVNRIALFLRRWAARELGRDETSLLGTLPEPTFVVTHDLDAVSKTWAIRFKQSVFHVFNSFRALRHGRVATAWHKGRAAARFGLTRGDFWLFDDWTRLEDELGIRSHINVYANHRIAGQSWKQMLIDPSYEPGEDRLRRCLRDLHQRGWTIGLHQSFNAWGEAEGIANERRRLENVLGLPITSCRQHWLRFSWEKTWRAQQAAGLTLDTTAGFNNRPGFRNGAALAWNPWDPATNTPLKLTAMPLVLMDSQVYDYESLDDESRRREIARWVGEVHAVHGVGTFLWHPHTLGSDYGWRDGFVCLLNEISSRSRARSQVFTQAA